MHSIKINHKAMLRAMQKSKDRAREKFKEKLYNNYLLLLAIILSGVWLYEDFSMVDADDLGFAIYAYIWAPIYILYRLVCFFIERCGWFKE